MIGVDVEVSSGVYETITTYSKIVYEKPLNANGFFDIVVAGNDSDYFTKFVNGKIIKIFKNGSIDFYGVIEKTSNTSQGFLRIEGVELGAKLFSKANASYKPYLNPNVTTVVADLLGKVSGVSSGTITSKTVPSFRTERNQNCLAGLNKLSELSDQDWYFSYSGATVYVNLVAHVGSSSSVGILNGVSDVGLVTKEVDDSSKIKKVTVIGAGIGSTDEEIIGEYKVGYSTGDAEKTIIDKSIISVAEANERAELEYNVLSKSRYVYSFNVLDANRVYDTGDVIRLVDGKTDTDSDVRITNIKRTVTQTEEKLALEVRSVDERSRNQDLLTSLNLLKASTNNANAMKQGTSSSDADIVLSGDITAAPSVTSITGAVIQAPSVTSITGTVTDGASDTSVAGSVSTNGASDNGYEFGVYTAVATNDSAWHTLANGVNTGENTFMFHSIWSSLNFNAENNSGSGGIWTGYVYFRALNDTNTSYYPDSTGHQIRFTFGLANGEHVNMSMGDYIHIPENWTNKTYYLQYKIVLNTTGLTGLNYYLAYSYHGSFGHTHGDNFSTTDSNHGHGDSIDTTDSNHNHTDSIDTTDSDHGHGDNFSSSDSGHEHDTDYFT